MGAIRTGNSLQYPNAGSAIAKSDVVVMGNCIGIAEQDIAATVGVGSVALEGVFSVPKVSAAVIAVGETLIYDVSAGEFNDNQATAAAGDVTAGVIAVEAGISTQTSIEVKLTPGAGTVT